MKDDPFLPAQPASFEKRETVRHRTDAALTGRTPIPTIGGMTGDSEFDFELRKGQTMSRNGFDAYYVWLGIAPEEQPPDHYRLLGLRRFEDNPDVISNAADQRMAFIRAAQTGEHALEAQRILNEISQARVVLSDTKRKALYDATLRRSATENSTFLAASGIPSSIGGRYREQPIATSPGVPTNDHSVSSHVPPVRHSPDGGHPASATTHHAAAGARGKRFDGSPRQSSIAWHVSFAGIVAGVGVAVAMLLALWFFAFRPERIPIAVVAIGPEVAETENRTFGASPQLDGIEPSSVSDVTLEVKPSLPAARSDDGKSADDQSRVPQVLDEPTTKSVPRPNGGDIGALPPEDIARNHEIDDPPSAFGRMPPPALEEQRKLLLRLDELYPATEFSTLENKVELAQQLLRMGNDQRADLTERFVLLRRSAELSSDAHDVALMSQAVGSLAEAFDIDPLAIEGKMLARMAQSGDGPEEEDEYAAYVCDFAESAMTDDEFELAAWVLTAATKSVSAKPASERMQTCMERVEERRERFRVFHEAERALNINPRDPDLASRRWVLALFREG